MLTIGISLKAYFGYRDTLAWCEAVGDLAAAHPVIGTHVRLVVFPALPALAPCAQILRDTPVEIGAQTISSDGPGAHTGEVPAEMLAEMDCRYAEIGHAERRSYYGETPEIVRRKVAAAGQAGLAPWLCVGETARSTPLTAARETLQHIRESGVQDASSERTVIAYEPVWAIGRAAPADPDYVRQVCDGLRSDVSAATAIVYGGSAGPGTLSTLYPAVSGPFLGRFAHDPTRVAEVLAEAADLAPQSVDIQGGRES